MILLHPKLFESQLFAWHYLCITNIDEKEQAKISVHINFQK